jgi:hypothetical protein
MSDSITVQSARVPRMICSLPSGIRSPLLVPAMTIS